MAWTENTKSTSSYTENGKSDEPFTQQFLNIGSGFNLLIDATNKLEIQAACASCTWANKDKS